MWVRAQRCQEPSRPFGLVAAGIVGDMPEDLAASAAPEDGGGRYEIKDKFIVFECRWSISW